MARRSERKAAPNKWYSTIPDHNIPSISDVEDEEADEFNLNLAEVEEESDQASFGSIPDANDDQQNDIQVHSRGNHAPDKFAATQESIKPICGLDPADVLPFVRSRNKWLHDPIYPTRHEKLQAGGLGFFPGLTQAMRSQEAQAGWKWYDQEEGRLKFQLGQQKRVLASEGLHHPTYSDAHQILLGPYEQQTLFELAPSQARAWRADREKDGWILNAGAKIVCLDWAPNQDGETQYLIIGTASKHDSGLEPSESYKPSIQIWSFDLGLELPRSLPQLVEVICTHWGGIREFKWCPMQRQSPAANGNLISLGLLAGIWSDGKVRVLDIDHQKAETTSYTSYNSIITACPPSTMATALTWLSPVILAVGLANGFLAIYNLSNLQSEPASPYIYTSIHQSYIYSLVSAYPLHPHMLISTSVDGYLRLTDLRTPDTDFVLCQRARLGSAALIFAPALHSVIAPGENDKTIRLLPLRRFYSSNSIAKVGAQVLSMAMGNTHTSLLIGSADGIVTATNPMRKVVAPKKPALQLAWFKYEWIKKEQGLKRNGISRFIEGFKAEEAHAKDLHRGKGGKIGFETIFEEETGITALTWNPNVHVGAWAAAGTGSGLVRVEDLALDQAGE